jgi:hypothetical protein
MFLFFSVASNVVLKTRRRGFVLDQVKPQNFEARSNRRRASMFNDSRKPSKFQEAPTNFSKIPRISSFFFVGVVFFLWLDDILVKMKGVPLNVNVKTDKM